MSTPELSPGTVIDGKYTVGAVLRTREGATTVEATDPTGSTVAVTVYGGPCFPSGLVLERSLRELRQLQSIDSDRIVKVLAVGKHGDGIYEVTEPTPAETLADHLSSGPLPLQDAAALIVQIGEALLEAQKSGVMHRNLGASVVFPSPEGAKVGGFAVGEPHGKASFGPLYTIAPEQVAGKVVDQRTLVYNVAALMHWMLSGKPLYEGDETTVLEQHASAGIPEGAHNSLQRALGKDPRMRPMMLKQFISELAKVGGVEPPKTGNHPRAPSTGSAPAVAPSAGGSAKPTSRGWTMFMQAQDDDESETAKPAAPAPKPPAAKPSTRGWTMFMQAQDDDESPAAEPEPAPAPAKPAAAAPPSNPAASVKPAASPADAAAKPSTRGWTMFMQAQDDDESPAEPEPAPAPAKPAAAAPPSNPAASVKPAASPADAAAKPSTRGWTMFMQAQDDEGPAKAADAEPEKPAAKPAVAAKPAAAPSAAPSKPTARGWTMFTSADEVEDNPATVPEQPAVPSTPQAPAADADKPAPSTRGWTMFMEPDNKPAAGAPSAGTPAAEAESPAAPAEASASQSAPTKGKSRGWTMFMEAPLADGQTPDMPGPDVKPAEPSAPVESDTKGWTVFGAPSPVAEMAKQAAAAEAGASAGRPPPGEMQVPKETMVVTEPPAGNPTPGAQGPDPAKPAVAKGKTMIATSSPMVAPKGGTMAPPSADDPAPAGATVAAGAGSGPGPMAFKKEDSAPDPHDPTARNLPAPSAPPEDNVPEPVAPVPSAPVPVGSTELAPQPSSNKVVYIVIGVAVVVGIVVGTLMALS